MIRIHFYSNEEFKACNQIVESSVLESEKANYDHFSPISEQRALSCPENGARFRKGKSLGTFLRNYFGEISFLVRVFFSKQRILGSDLTSN
jgi:hypothetical protein